MGPPLLHGTLLATIYQASNLVNEHRRTPKFLRKLCTCYNVQVIEEIEEITSIGKGASKLYTTIDLGAATVARTVVKKHSTYSPVWNQPFHVYCAYETDQVTIKVKDQLTIGAVVVGVTQIPVTQILSGDVVDGWYDLYSEQHSGKMRGQIHVKLQFVSVEKDPSWGAGIKGSEFTGVHHTFFKQERGNRITLYQDAHMLNDFMPKIPLSGGSFYQPTRCWEDIYKAISEAKHLIYIAGWSVYTKIALVRDEERMIPGAEGLILGELLKKKADEGVRVLLLVWDDRTSVSLGLPGALTTGIMHTHDEDTGAYFQGSKVHCILCPRNPDDGATAVQGVEIGLMFTHHQKTVVVDVAVSEEEQVERKLVSFVGGIDLCDGRYDNQTHSLFRTLDSIHKDDFYQKSFDGASLKQGGPREPWHDVHCRIEGPAAWDVHFNFEQRWKRQGRKNLLLPLKSITNVWPPRQVIADDDQGAWNAQIFRSIDEGAVVDFPTQAPEFAAQMGLVTGKENVIDRSIQDAYIRAIRRAKHFIYMENQYFLGSSASWSSHQDAGAIQLVPMELTLKIISKIEAGERFAVYVVVPMWPEGVPEGPTVQSILYWQRLTMEMMYKRIALALEKEGMADYAKPTDYLNFFCLGNREVRHGDEYKPPEAPKEGTDYHSAQVNRRSMIYVHAKTMIVDDEYIIVGSANCNQRSMDGARDSEIAVGAYQPQHTMDGPFGSRPRGQVHGFRMSLWYEHLGRLSNIQYPETLECVHAVRKTAEELWNWYSGEKVIEMPGHLLAYPITVLENGEVKSLDGFENFPDTKAPVLGTHHDRLPSLLTV